MASPDITLEEINNRLTAILAYRDQGGPPPAHNHESGASALQAAIDNCPNCLSQGAMQAIPEMMANDLLFFVEVALITVEWAVHAPEKLVNGPGAAMDLAHTCRALRAQL